MSGIVLHNASSNQVADLNGYGINLMALGKTPASYHFLITHPTLRELPLKINYAIVSGLCRAVEDQGVTDHYFWSFWFDANVFQLRRYAQRTGGTNMNLGYVMKKAFVIFNDRFQKVIA